MIFGETSTPTGAEPYHWSELQLTAGLVIR
jgi:hypothetical protein